jgi:glucose-6-phosphate 1-dehydrogenase
MLKYPCFVGIKGGLSIIVIGASGDLAKKKTFPALLNLFADNLLPKDLSIWGYARSDLGDDGLRDRVRPFLMKEADDDKSKITKDQVDAFLQTVRYKNGDGYGDVNAFKELASKLEEHETKENDDGVHNRLFYFAIPPNVFAETGKALKQTAMATRGWTRVIVEKPFGRDLESYKELSKSLSQSFTEEQIYRIDHYLGKEMVQNLMVLRFGNLWFERLWNRDSIQSVTLTFKEPFGTEGRGGYFDKYGIIRDIQQNHLLQVFCLMAMEAPLKVRRHIPKHTQLNVFE